jgi:GAF domain-containing protein
MANDLSAGIRPVAPADREADVERTLEALRVDAQVAHVLLGFSSALAEVRTVDATLETAVRMIPEVMGCDRCFVAALNRSDQRLYVLNRWGFTEEEAKSFQSFMHSSDAFPLTRQAIEKSATVIVENATADPRIPPEEAKQRRLGAFMRVPLIRRGEVFGALGIEYREPRAFGSKDESLAAGIARQLGVAIANARQFNLLNSLSKFGLRVGTQNLLQPVREEVARGAADLLGGDGARYYFMDLSQRSLLPAAGFGQAPPESYDRIEIDDRPWHQLVEGRTVMISDSDPELQNDKDLSAIVAAPVPAADGSLIGAVVVFFDHQIALGPDETEALNVLASQSALAIENARRFERQRRVARSLQRGLLSTESPDLLEGVVEAVYEPASSESDVGGDFYDIFELRKGLFGLVVGDVSGKGAEAAAITAQAKYMLRAFASRNRAPASVLFHLNNALVASLSNDRFATLVYIVYDPTNRTCIISNGGHPAPLLYRSSKGSVQALELPGTILGAFRDQQFEQTSFFLDDGDVLLAYTDGLTEARSDDGEMFGRGRVESALSKLAPRTRKSVLARALYREAKAFGRVTDDTVVFTLGSSRD